MSAFEKAWVLLKGNPDARVQAVNPTGTHFSDRDFAAHPAAIGAANRQVYATMQNKQKLIDSGMSPNNPRLMVAARKKVTPQQRREMENTSFDLKYKNPNFISRVRERGSGAPKTKEEKAILIQEAEDAKARRREAGFNKRGRKI